MLNTSIKSNDEFLLKDRKEAFNMKIFNQQQMGPSGRLGEINLPVSPGKLWRGNTGKEILQVLIRVTDCISL